MEKYLQTTPGGGRKKLKDCCFTSRGWEKPIRASNGFCQKFWQQSCGLTSNPRRLESKQGEEKRVSVVNATGLQTPIFNSDRFYKTPFSVWVVNKP